MAGNNRGFLISFIFAIWFVIYGTGSFAQFRVGYYEKGRIELSKENYTAALEYLNYAITQNDYYDAYFLRGVAKYNLGDLRGAENDYTHCIEKAPFHKDALLFRAVVRDRQFDFGRALQDYEQALSLDSTDWRIYLNRSILYLFLKNFEAVIRDCNKAIEFKLPGERAYIIRGIANTGLEQYDAALEDFEIAINRNPKNNFARIQRGICYSQMGLTDTALTDFEWVLKQDSLNTRALFQRALLRINNNEPLAALHDLNIVIEQNPYNASAVFNRAIVKSRLDDHSGAIQDYDIIIRKQTNNILAYYNRAGAKQQVGDLQGSLQDYNRAIELYPEFADAYLNRSMVKREMNDYRGAEIDYQYADSLNQASFSVNDSLDERDAVKLLKMITLAGDVPDKNHMTGKVQYEHADIMVKPFYVLAPFPGYDGSLAYYNATGKRNYEWEIISLAISSDSTQHDRIQQEIDSLEQTSGKGSLDKTFYIKRATLYTYQENYNKAFLDFDRVIALDPTNILAFFGRANTRLRLSELLNEFEPQTALIAGQSMKSNSINTYSGSIYDEIIKDYNRVIALDPDFYFACFNRSYVKYLIGDFTGAVVNLTMAININPDFAEAYYNRGITNIYLKNIVQGCEDLSKAGELGLNEAYNIILRYCDK